MTSIIGCTPENEDGSQQNWAILKCKRFLLDQFRSQGICAKVEPRPSQTRNSASPKLLEQDSIKLVLYSHWVRVNLKTKIKLFIIIFNSWSKKNPSQNCGNPETLLGWCLMFVHREDMGNTSIYHIRVHVYDVKLRNMQLVCQLSTHHHHSKKKTHEIIPIMISIEIVYTYPAGNFTICHG